MAYNARTTTPSKSNKYFYKNNIFYQCGYGLPNCTAYAWGRFYEITGKKPSLSTSNAENWWGHTSDGYQRGQTPKLGAVICWAKGKAGNGADGAGHVGIVEAIYADGTILVGQSGWKASKVFWTTKIKPPYKLSGYTFQGFIYNPAVTTATNITKPVAGKTYTLTDYMNVRTGPGTGYGRKKVSGLTADGKKNATSASSTAYAVLKPGTKVTAIAVSGDWIKIPSGWVCWKQGNVKYIQ